MSEDFFRDSKELSVFHGEKEILEKFKEAKELALTVKDGYAYFWYAAPSLDYDLEDEEELQGCKKLFLEEIKNQNFEEFDFYRWFACKEYAISDDGGSLYSVHYVRVTIEELFDTATIDETEVSFVAEPMINIYLEWTHRDKLGDHFNLLSLKENPNIKV